MFAFKWIQEMTQPGGTYLENGFGDMQQERPPFNSPSATPQDPLFSIFSPTSPQFNRLTFPFKMPNFGKFLVPNPKNRSKTSWRSLSLSQTSVLKTIFCQKKKKKKKKKLN